jgi:hypothetical protein
MCPASSSWTAALRQVLTLTADGPIGKFKCKLRTLMTLCLLHQRLLKEVGRGRGRHFPYILPIIS